MKRFLIILFLMMVIGTVSADQMIFNTSATGDAHANRYVSGGATFSALRSGAGTAVSTTMVGSRVLLTARSSGSTFTNLSRAGYQFDTSGLPDNAVISSAIVSVYGNAKSNTFATAPSFALVSFTPATNGTMVAADYNKGGTSPLSDAITYTSLSTIAYNNFTVSDLTTISKTSWTRYMIKSSWDYTNTPPTWGASYSMTAAFETNESATGKKPLLTVVYTLPVPPDTTPPASLTDLNNTTTTCSSINWTWTNPKDPDFNLTMIWQNDVFLKNVTNITTFDLWSYLPENTQYTISTKTVDITGNVNASFVNKTETTLYCGDNPIVNTVVQEPHPITDDLNTIPRGDGGDIEINPKGIMASYTKMALLGETFPYNVSVSESQTEIKILKFRCTPDICGYWIQATRGGTEIATDSPIWISPPPYEVVVSDEYNARTNIQTILVREDPKQAVEDILKAFIDYQPVGNSVVGTPE